MILFFDDHDLSDRNNLTRDYNSPQEIKGLNYKDPCGYSMCGALPNVFFDENLGKYVMIYTCLEPETSADWGILMLCATSDDGINWTPYDTTHIKMENRRMFNQICPITSGEGIVFKDERAPKEERYKLLYCRYAENFKVKNEIYVSPDWLHWTKLDSTWNEEGAEPGLGCFYSEAKEKYVITCRPSWGERRLCVTETEDFRSFTPIELAAETDSLDNPLSEIYGMPAFKCDNYYIGLLWLYQTPAGTSVSTGKQVINLNGKMAPELAYSLNGTHFMRSLRKPFINNSTPDKPYFGCMYANSMIEVGDEYFIYCACSQGEHGGFRTEGLGSIVGFRIKKNRFIFLESNGLGTITTKNLLINGKISVNAHIFGEMKCRFTKDGKPVDGFDFEDFDTFSGDETEHILTWHKKTTEELKGQALTLEIQMFGGRIFAINGDFTPLPFNLNRLYNTFGTKPARKGF